MTLQLSIDTMFAYATGRLGLNEAATRLGIDPESQAARRLEVSRRAYVHTVEENVGVTFPVTRQIVVAACGEERWRELCLKMGTEHPLDEIRFGAKGFIHVLRDVLAEDVARQTKLPSFVADLAELELAERRILAAPDPERLTDSVEDGHPNTAAESSSELAIVRPCSVLRLGFEVLAVRNAPDPLVVQPPERATVYAIWRIEDGTRRTKSLSRSELRILHAIRTSGAGALADVKAAPAAVRARDMLQNLLSIGLVQEAMAS